MRPHHLLLSFVLLFLSALPAHAQSNNDDGAPVCLFTGTRSEGWYRGENPQGEEDRIRWSSCGGCTAKCSAIGTRSEGWYESCTGELITYARCGGNDASSSSAGCVATCRAIGTRSEGLYDSCTGKLIAYTQCGDASSFSDVPRNHPNADAIEYVRTQGIVSGYPDGTFRPEQRINRAEFTKIIIGATADAWTIDHCDRGVLQFFSDVPERVWFSPYICLARVRGVVQGHLFSNKKPEFWPGREVLAVEAAKIITVGFGIGDPPLDCATYPMICIEEAAKGNTWYKRHIDALAERNAIPLSITSFQKEITRGEMAEIIYRVHAGITEKPSQTFASITANIPPPPTPTVVITTDYILRYRYESNPSSNEPWDATIVSKERNSGTEKAVVKSIKELLPELRERLNLTLFPFAQPSDDLVIFQEVLADTDSGGGPLYAFRPSTGYIQKMRVNEFFKGFSLAKDTKNLSEDKTTLIWVPDQDDKGDEKILYLIDLVKDNYRVLVRLSGNETFDAMDFAGGIGSQHTDLSWLDGDTVLYAVFDQSKKPASTYEGKDILIGYRKVRVR